MKTLQEILSKDLTHEITKSKHQYISKKQYIIGLMKDELVGKIKKKICSSENDGQVDKRAKVTSKCIIK